MQSWGSQLKSEKLLSTSCFVYMIVKKERFCFYFCIVKLIHILNIILIGYFVLWGTGLENLYNNFKEATTLKFTNDGYWLVN